MMVSLPVRSPAHPYAKGAGDNRQDPKEETQVRRLFRTWHELQTIDARGDAGGAEAISEFQECRDKMFFKQPVQQESPK